MSESELVRTRLEQLDSTSAMLLEIASILGERLLADSMEGGSSGGGGYQRPGGPKWGETLDSSGSLFSRPPFFAKKRKKKSA